jgi:hypothetical protein
MVGQFGNQNRALAGKNASGTRAPWSTPRVIASDLGDARANVDFGADGFQPGYGLYGS